MRTDIQRTKRLFNSVTIAAQMARATNQGEGDFFVYHVDKLENVISLGFFKTQQEADMAYIEYLGRE